MNQLTGVMADLIAMSQQYGSDSAFVLAGGGNTSTKQGNRLWVKGSGHALATIDADGFVELDRDLLEAMFSADWPTDAKERESLFMQRVMAARINPELKQRPSVEALIHHLLPDPFVVHTHPGIVNALTCCVEGEALARQLLGREILWQPYVDPGVVLAQALRRSLIDHRKRTGRAPAAILLANHGLIVSGTTAKGIEEISNRLVARIRSALAERPRLAWDDQFYTPQHDLIHRYATAMRAITPSHYVVTDATLPIARLVGSVEGRDAALAGPLTPDQIVYCRSTPLWIDEPSSDLTTAKQQLREAISAYESVNGFDPWVALIAGVGMLTFRESPKLAETTRAVFVDAAEVYHNAARFGGVHVMPRRDQQFIEQWEVEAYRRAVMSKPSNITQS